MTGRLRTAAAVTAAGGVLLVLATAALDSARFWDLSLTRSQAVERARGVAESFGLDASRWGARVRIEEDDAVRRFLEVSEAPQKGAGFSALTPVLFAVRLEDSGEENRLEVSLDGRGGLHRLSLRPFQSPVEEDAEGQRAAADVAGAKALKALVDPVGNSWELVEDRAVGENGWRFSWQQAASETPSLSWQAEATVRGDTAHDLEVKPILSGVPPRLNRQKDLGGILNLLLILALLTYGVQSQRYHHPHRNVMALGLLTLLLAVFASISRSGPSLYEKGSVLFVAFASLVDPILLRALGAALLFAAGCAAGRRWFPDAVASLETLLTRDWWARNVAQSAAWGVASGVSFGVLIALAVAVTRAVGGPGAALLLASDPAAAGARWPFLVALAPRLELAFLAYFGMVVPLVCGLVRRPRLARILAAPVGALLLAPVLPVEGAPLVVLGLSLLAVVALDQVYGRAGLLAVLVAAWASGAAARGAGLAVQPGLLSLSGWLTLMFLVGVAFGASFLTKRLGASPGLLPASLPLPQRLRAERERIKAQLGVAQEAQARMLPAAPPEIPGWSVAAVCRPAREVGGDLYDFIPAEDGRLAILVGDVSGKGMVASLYMTLTKGLVLATSEEVQAPAEVMVAVNEGLYRVTERGVFVTAWLGLLDPVTGHLSHARAGHNPLLWRRVRRGETLALTPKGLPLGAVGNHMFAPSLEEEDLQVEPGDALFIYSDGLSEAMDAHRNEYGEDRLIATVGRTDGLSAERARDAVLADVDAFVGTAPQHDDMTLLVLRFEPIAER